jgi:hypothetical protein
MSRWAGVQVGVFYRQGRPSGHVFDQLDIGGEQRWRKRGAPDGYGADNLGSPATKPRHEHRLGAQQGGWQQMLLVEGTRDCIGCGERGEETHRGPSQGE